MRISSNHFQDTGVRNMQGQQNEISRTQTQLASGREVLRPSDNPTSAARALDLERAISSVERFNRNADMAESRLSMAEANIDQVGTHLQRIRELAIQAANDSQDHETRSYIASEVKERYEQLIQVANSQDGNGEYLFAGSRTRTRPFSPQADGSVEYLGDQNQRRVRVGPGREIPVDNSGFQAFMDIQRGNGLYDARENPGNTGYGVVQVVDGGVQRMDPSVAEYRLRFAEDDNGDVRYGVQSRPRGSDAGDPDAWQWVNPPAGAEGQPPSVEDAPMYERGMTIEVDDGIRVMMENDPDPADDFSSNTDAGDTFHVEASRPHSVFESVREFIGALETGSGPKFRNAVNRTVGDLDIALEKTFETRAEIGARLSTLDTERAGNEAAIEDLKKAKSQEEDLDYAEATGRFNQKLTGLEAAQSSFGRLQNLSLFNYL